MKKIYAGLKLKTFLAGCCILISISFAASAYAQQGGCVDASACNYDPYATYDNGTCTYPGCMDPTANNYDASAGCSGTCTYTPTGSQIQVYAYSYNASTCTSSDGSIYVYAYGGDGSNNYYFYLSDGESQTGNYAIFSNLSSGSYTVTAYDNNNQNDGYSNSTNAFVNYNSCGGSGTLISASVYSSTDESCPGSDDASITVYATGGDGSNNYYIQAYNGYDGQWYTSGSSSGSNYVTLSGLPDGYFYYIYVYDANNANDGLAYYFSPYRYIAITNPTCGGTGGCTSSNACNYNSSATYDDGSCSYPGCTNPSANNYNPSAGCDDGSCTYTSTDSQIQVYAYSYNASTCTSSDGSIYVYAYGGDGSNNYYFYLSDGESQTGNYAIFSNLPSGSYTITVYDNSNTGDGFSNSASTSVSYNSCGNSGSPISASIYSSTNESCAGSNNGSIIIYATGGDGTNNYYAQLYNSSNGQWYYSSPSNGSNYISISGIPGGVYAYLYVYDSNNSGDGFADYSYPYYTINDDNIACGSSISAYVSSSTNESCPSSNDGSITINATGGDGANNYYAVAYLNGSTAYTSANTNGSNSITISGLTSGYYYYIYVYDANNPNDGFADYLYSYTYISDNNSNCGNGSVISAYIYTSTNETCPGSDDGSITVYVTGGDGTDNYFIQAYNANNGQWYTSGSSNGSNSVTLSNIPAGDYAYVYVYDASNSSDGLADYTYPYYYLGDNNSSCGNTGSAITASVYSSTDETCPGSDDGSLSVYATGGDGTNNYYFQVYNETNGQWYTSGSTNGSNYITLSGIPAGYYAYLYVYDASNPYDGWADYLYPYYSVGDANTNCSGSGSSQIYIDIYEGDNYSCSPNYSGYLYGYAYGGNGNYDFSCNCGQPDQYGSYFYFTSLAPGSYSVTASDGANYAGTNSAYINDYSSGCNNGPAQITVDIYEGDNYGCAPNYSGYLYGYGNGGNGNYDFSCGCGQADQYGSYFYFTGLAPGSYTVTANDGTNYPGSNSATINDYSSGCGPNQIYVGIYEGDNYDCAPNYDGYVRGYAYGGNGNYDFSCGCGQPDQYGSSFSFDNLAPGSYTITASDGTNYAGSGSVTVNDYSSGCGPVQLSVDIYEGDNYGCAPNYNGYLYGYTYGGNGNYDFSCGCGQPDQYGSYFYFTGLAPGSYTVTASDGTDYPGSGSAYINDFSSGCNNGPTQIYVTIDEGDNYDCAPNYDGYLYGYAYGGNGNYDFSCGCGQPDQYGSYFYFTGLAPGSYSVAASDNTDYPGSNNAYINDYSTGCNTGPAQIYIGIYAGDNYSCAPNYDGYVSGYAYNGNGNYDFSCGCGQPDQYGSSFYFTGLAPGSYTITATDGTNAAGSGSATVIDYSSCGPFQIVIGVYEGNNYACSPNYDGYLYGYAYGGNGNYDFSCSCGQPDQYGSSFNFTGLAPGSYSVTVNDGTNYPDSGSVYISDYSYGCSAGPTQIYVNISETDNYDCPPNFDGSVSGTAYGGNGFYTFSCSCGQPEQYGSYFYFYNLGPGFYTVYASDGTNYYGSNDAYVNEDSSDCSRSISDGVVPVSDIQNIDIWSSTDKLYIDFTKMSSVEATIHVYNVLGQQLYSERFENNALYIKQIDNVEIGYIIVQVNNNDALVTRKLFISGNK